MERKGSFLDAVLRDLGSAKSDVIGNSASVDLVT